MKKDKYEISLWEDIIVGASYALTTDNPLIDGKTYYFYNEKDSVYSSGVEGSTISSYKTFPGNDTIKWYKDNIDTGEKEELSLNEVLNSETIYYLIKDNNYFGVYGSTIRLYKETKWYEMVTAGHHEEEKLSIIGSNTMNAAFRAREPKLVTNTNGTATLTFKMFYNYVDTETGEKKENPFIKLLVNERKIKAKWKNKWYNLIVKGIQEDSNGKTITYTCKDQYITELSKTGFNLEFSNELMNNQGSISELGERVLEGTDWKLDTSDIIRQTIEEPVYDLSGIQVKSFVAKNEITDEDVTIPDGAKILVYYSVFNEKKSYFQFHYVKDGKFLTENNSMLITNGDCLSVDNVTWEENSIKYNNQIIITFPQYSQVSNFYRAKRLVKSQLQEFEVLTEQYCYVYNTQENGTGEKVYGYIDTKTTDATMVINLLANNGFNGFTGSEGWTTAPNLTEAITMPFGLYPPLTQNNATSYLDGDIRSYLKFTYIEEQENPYGGVRYRNNGVSNNTQYLEEGFKAGETYIFRYQAVLIDELGTVMKCNPATDTAPIRPRIGEYNDDYSILSSPYYFKYKRINKENSGDWFEYQVDCIKSISKNDIRSKNFDFIFSVYKTCWLKEAQFFKYEEGNIRQEDGTFKTGRMNPNEIDAESVITPVYKYFYAESAKGLTDIDQLEYIYEGTVDIAAADTDFDDETDEGGNATDIINEYNLPTLYPVYSSNNFEKIRSIEAKQSNRFNIIQTLAETFEAYPKFEIINDPETGKIDYYKRDENGQLTNEYIGPQKFISFHESIGQETGLSFIYGIDLKTISRTINSDQIVTKTIVIPNTNQYGKNGFCTIARASDNQSKSNFILNFDYYCSHGLINIGALNLDLYDTSGNSLGYYYNLGRLNKLYDESTELLMAKKTELTKLENSLKVYEEYLEATEEEKIKTITKIETLSGQNNLNTVEAVREWLEANEDFEEVRNCLLTWVNLENNIESYKTIIDNLKLVLGESGGADDSNATGLYKTVAEHEKSQENIVKQIDELDKRFYEKYSRYIQEGSWTSEEYIDDNLYYLDAKSVSYTSSRPQVQYNISVLRLSALDEFKNKIFNLGDIATIQDTEFFGYKWIDNIKTPYKEKVLISEIVSNFDSPENDSFKVQNYKTQFEDLFQRITAATQSLQYASGEYQKAANVIENDGTIKASILQNSLALNQNIMISSQNNAYTLDATGITLTDISNPNRKVKLTSGGLIFTNDGETWKTGIDADGIRADYLTTGAINTNDITIYSGKYPTFRWTSSGLDAYSWGDTGVNFGKFVRFDQYGIYGINNVDNSNSIWTPEGEDQIWDEANFGMTWKGFFVKNREGDGWVEVSSENDVAIFKDDLDEPKIKIGRLGKDVENNIIYGIKIADNDGQTVLISGDDGKLWLKDRLIVETYDKNNKVQIGKLDSESSKDEIHGGRVIHADGDVDENGKQQEFIVYEDGHMKATSGEFTGTINATGGTIGNMTIEQVENTITANQKLEIKSSKGFNFKISGENGSPSEIQLIASPQGFEVKDQGITWYGSNDFSNWNNLPSNSNTPNTYILSYNNFKDKNKEMIYYIKAVATATDNKQYEDWQSILGISDGKNGEDPINLVITPSNGNYFRNNQGSTTLTARLYQSGREIDDIEPYDYNYEWKDNNGVIIGNTKSITVTADDVNFNRTYICNVSKGG